MSPTSRLACVVGALVLLAGPIDDRARAQTFVDRWEAGDVRVLSYNVYRDAIFDGSTNQDKFARIVNAVNPDIIALQEIYSYSGQHVASLLDTVSPLGGGDSWTATRRSDNVIATRHSFSLTGGALGHVDALVDLPDEDYSWDLFLLNDHLPCCDNERGRQAEADEIISWLRDAREDYGPDDNFTLPLNTPFAVLGDFNIVRSGRPLETLLTGDVVYRGEDSPPDWDGTPIADARPLQNGLGPDDYTWRDDAQIYDPGVLDFVLFSDSVLEVANKFVLNTVTMSTDELMATGLQANDVVLYPSSGTYDHLPLVVDFRLRPQFAPGDYNRDGSIDIGDYPVWKEQFGMEAAPAADGNGDGRVDVADYTIWRDALGAAPAASTVAPTPATVWQVGALLLALPHRRRRQSGLRTPV